MKDIEISYFQDTEDHIGTTGSKTLAGRTPAGWVLAEIGKLTDRPEIRAVDVTGSFAQVHLFRDTSGTWIYQTIGTSV